MQNQNVEVSVLVNGNPIKQFGKDGRTYVMAQDGKEWSLRIKNSNPFRVLAVVAVDGLDTITGQKASLKDGGYVVDAYSSAEIVGYRKDLSTAAAFRFTKKEKAYATEKGAGENVGVIAVAIFKERDDRFEKLKKEFEEFKKKQPEKEYLPWPVYPPYRPWRPYDPWYDRPWYQPYYYGTWTTGGSTWAGLTCTSAQANVSNSSNESVMCFNACSAQPQASANMMAQTSEKPFRAGSTWGSKISDTVKEVPFERESDTPYSLFTIYYDFRLGLEKIGVKLEAEETEVSFPQGFPSFAQPPKGWTG